MPNLPQTLIAWSNAVWPPLLNHLWQSTLFALALLPAVALARRAPARLRYGCSLLVSAKFVLPASLLTAALYRLVPDADRLAGLSPQLLDLSSLLYNLRRWLGGAAPRGSAATAAGDGWLFPLLTLLWLAGALALASRWWLRRQRFRRVLATGRRVSDGPEVALLERARSRLGLRRRVGLVLLEGAGEAGVWGILRPRVVLPAAMPRHLDAAELEALFLHELIHVRRWDNLVASLHMALCCLFWFHPIVWLLDRRLLAEREEACDERVLELDGRADTYLRGLLKAVRFSLGWRLAGVSSAGASNLRRRLERLAAGNVERSSRRDAGVVAALVVFLLLFSLAAGGSIASRCTGDDPARVSAAAPFQPGTAATPGLVVPAEAPPLPSGYEPCAKSRSRPVQPS